MKIPRTLTLLLPLLAACSSQVSDPQTGAENLTQAQVSANFSCPAPSADEFALTIVMNGLTVKVSEPHITPVTRKLNAKHEADLGNFDAPEGSYTIVLDEAMVGGKSGTAHLVYDDPDGSKKDTAYTCGVTRE